MSEIIWASAISTIVPLLLAIGAALVYLFKAAREAGRAESYRESAERTIKEQHDELQEATQTIASQARIIDELRGTLATRDAEIAMLRMQLGAAS